MVFSEINKKLEAKKHTTLHHAKRIGFSGVWLTAVLLIVQIIMLLDIFMRFGQHSPYIFEILSLVSSAVMVYIINDKSNPAYKIAWIIPVMLMPLFGGVLYLFVKLNFGALAPKRVLNRNLDRTKKYAKTSDEVRAGIEKEEASFGKLADYIEQTGGYPAWGNTSVSYYALGDDTMEVLVEELKKAKKYIFLEYFIIEEGIFWNQILEILEEKAKEGLDVRVMYDDFGCVALLPRKYHMLLKQKGIRCRKYAALTPVLSTHLNNRDHRKMIVIDGVTAFSGGINLADEYINAYDKYGHWKDNGFLLKGDGVYNYTMMFLQMWNINSASAEEDFSIYLEKRPLKGEESTAKQERLSEEEYSSWQHPGYVIPYGDGPHQLEDVAKNVYMDILNRTRKYVYIMTPYLILDYEMQQALEHAAKCGVDVRIIMPHIPDKKMVFYIGRTYYPQLIRAGVKIYEYTPGFVHSKTFLSDGDMATVGTINLDFRSLYLHYECGTLFYKTEGLDKIKEDFQDTFEKCQPVNMQDYYRFPLRQRMAGRVLRVFGPLL
ncbi:MAG: cardiolipin synthase [Lachnospiraceae bacterium]|nr:cardiolipin synthase [Lachnospiraceae bacterium]MDY5699689.1 cardiolipin synthase [Lachnospiraceae bacterium]